MDDELTIVDVLGQLRTSPIERTLFSRTDTDSTRAKVAHLTAAADYFNAIVVREYGGRLGPARGRGLVEQVVAAAFQSFAGQDPRPGPIDKAAMLVRGITQGHPFNDGNKRTGFLVAAYFLDLIGYRFPDRFDFALAEELCLRVSAGDIRDVSVIAAALQLLWTGQLTSSDAR